MTVSSEKLILLTKISNFIKWRESMDIEIAQLSGLVPVCRPDPECDSEILTLSLRRTEIVYVNKKTLGAKTAIEQ